MKITLSVPLGIHEQGKRKNNEDTIFPLLGRAKSTNNVFIVCDGMGGAASGDKASQLAVEGFSSYFEKEPPPPMSDEAYINKALSCAQNKFDAHLEKHFYDRGMGTTLTLVHFHAEGVTIAHIGDSRVYHIREDKILFKTDDHSMVSEMVRGKVFTPEEAIGHPHRNVITRAIQGTKKSKKSTKPDVKITNDIQKGDYFFLCTDGILEGIGDEKVIDEKNDQALVDILKTSDSNDQKIQTIKELCKKKSRDNFSAYLIQIASVSGKAHSIKETKKETKENTSNISHSKIIIDAEVIEKKSDSSTSDSKVTEVTERKEKISTGETVKETDENSPQNIQNVVYKSFNFIKDFVSNLLKGTKGRKSS